MQVFDSGLPLRGDVFQGNVIPSVFEVSSLLLKCASTVTVSGDKLVEAYSSVVLDGDWPLISGDALDIFRLVVGTVKVLRMDIEAFDFKSWVTVMVPDFVIATCLLDSWDFVVFLYSVKYVVLSFNVLTDGVIFVSEKQIWLLMIWNY